MNSFTALITALGSLFARKEPGGKVEVAVIPTLCLCLYLLLWFVILGVCASRSDQVFSVCFKESVSAIMVGGGNQ